MKIKVKFYSELLKREIEKEFDNHADAAEFAKTVGGIVVA